MLALALDTSNGPPGGSALVGDGGESGVAEGDTGVNDGTDVGEG